MRSFALYATLTLIVCSVTSSLMAADTLIYNNSTYQGYYSFYNSNLTDVYDYGTSLGGLVKKISFGYRNPSYTTSWVRISFYGAPDTYYVSPGYFIKTIEINNIPPSSGSYSVYDYTLPENDRFTLPNGSFGFSIAMSNYSTSLIIASGNTGNPDELWIYANDWLWGWDWYVFGGFSNAVDSLYMKIWTGPPIDEITCDISGYKFNDTNGNGVWNAGEPALPGWEFYLDTDNDGIRDASEPNVVTDPNGLYFFENKPSPATYRVREILKTGWTQTLPGSAGSYQYVVATEPNHVYGPYNFGNTQSVIKYGGGSGTESDPYIISTAAHLQQLGATPADWAEDKYFSLTADLNLSAYTGTSYKIIGTSTSNAFHGFFEGNNHTISNLTYSTTASTAYIGLFGCFNGSLKNLKMTNVSVNAPNANYVGAIAGHLGAWIQDCGVESGTVNGYNYVGGIAGYIDRISLRISAVFRSYSKCSLVGNQYVGGIAGYTENILINQCYSNSPITASNYAGGIFGKEDASSLILETCYATGYISGNNRGGLLGDGSATSIQSFWDQQTTNCMTSGAGEPKTTAQMKSAETFKGWGCSGLWTINEGVDYPRLASENKPGTPLTSPTYGGGSGTQADPYLIYTTEQFNDIGKHECHNSAYFKLMDDIVLDPATANNFSPIGYYRVFTGSFDGNYHVIFNPNFVQSDSTRYFTGIFTRVGVSNIAGEVKNMGIINPTISSAGTVVGGLCGYLSNGTIDNCFVRGGSILGVDGVGGLIGVIDGDTSQIQNCYTNTSVSGQSTVAGLASGCGNGTIEFCYSAGPVNGIANTGGLIGDYSAGQINNAYYDQDTTGQSGGQGTALSTTAMHMMSSYVNWDFINIWRMCDGTNYPRLKWETNLAGDFGCPDGVGVEDFAKLSKCWNSVLDLQSDISGDMQIDLADVAALGTYWMRIGCGVCGGKDITGDGNVNMTDLEILIDEWLLRKIPACSVADLSGDKIIDIEDLMLFCDNWLHER